MQIMKKNFEIDEHIVVECKMHSLKGIARELALSWLSLWLRSSQDQMEDFLENHGK